MTAEPLHGISVVVTRSRHQAGELSAHLEQLGASVVEVPTIDIVVPDDGGAALRSTIERMDDYDWLVVTSVNTVDRIVPLLAGRSFRPKVAAIGPATGDALRSAGIETDLVPREYVAESLVDAFPTGSGKVLIPRASVARDVLPKGLSAKGWSVEVVPAYKTIHADIPVDAFERVSAADAISFTSSSTVESFVESFGAANTPKLVACIGPITAATAQQLGLNVDVTAEEHTIPGLVRALASANF